MCVCLRVCAPSCVGEWPWHHGAFRSGARALHTPTVHTPVCPLRGGEVPSLGARSGHTRLQLSPRWREGEGSHFHHKCFVALPMEPLDGFNAGANPNQQQRADRAPGMGVPQQQLRFGGSVQADGGAGGLDEFEMLASYLTAEEGQFGSGEFLQRQQLALIPLHNEPAAGVGTMTLQIRNRFGGMIPRLYRSTLTLCSREERRGELPAVGVSACMWIVPTACIATPSPALRNKNMFSSNSPPVYV